MKKPSRKRPPVTKPELIESIKRTADRLAEDDMSRGDLKMLNRTLRELRYALKVFRPFRRRRKVTVFGSARTAPDHPAYEQAKQFGKVMAEHGWMVITGAASGIMEAAHVGAGRENSMGLNIMLPFEQSANAVIAGDHKLVNMKYFFTRKVMLVKECHALVCLPGGFGTQDEALEVLTLLQTGKHDPAPVVLLDEPGGLYWSEFDRFVRANLQKGGMISAEDTRLYQVTDDCQTAIDECVGFFRIYHSMRYVGDRLVMRLNEELSPELLDEIRASFQDILKAGGFEQTNALEAESDDAHLADLPRLVFRFNRRSLARLRMLIDDINRGSTAEQIDDPISHRPASDFADDDNNPHFNGVNQS